MGADRLAADNFKILAGHRVGLVTNHTAMVGDRHLADILHAAPSVQLVALYGPEHGIRGDAPAGAKVGDEVDPKTGVPVLSLYGKTRKPTPEMLENVDIMVFDIQDVGARFYTYISTLGYCMQAAANKGIPFVVLDRPNPLGGNLLEGAIMDPGLETFVGLYPIPVVHGLTIGELAKIIQGEKMLDGLEDLELTVVPMEGWKREMLWSDIGEKWNPPSPNLPDFETALIYPGACFFEGVSASEGRGTQEPFLVLGAPWVDGEKMAAELNRRELPGLKFEATSFTPEDIPNMAKNPKFKGQKVFGVRHIVTDANKVRPVAAGVNLLDVFLAQAPEKEEFFQAGWIRALSGTKQLQPMLMAGKSPEEILASWESGLEKFRETRQAYLLY